MLPAFLRASRRRQIAAALLLACSLLPGCSREVAAPEPIARRPNLLLIVADDLGYADAGFQGSADIATPQLDALAARGVRFAQAYVPAPQCAPSRAGLLTGRHPARFGFEFNPVAPADGLPLAERTLAEALRAAGYRTGLVGKWHLGATPDQHPNRRGFDTFYGFLGGAHAYRQGSAILRNSEPAPYTDYLTDAFAREAAAFIAADAAAPWFLYLAFNAPHAPLDADADRLSRLAGIADPRRRTYAAMVAALDDGVGTVLQALRASGQDADTVVVFVNDNGGPTMPGITVTGASNAPLRGSKRTLLEGGLRVPMLLVWPGQLSPQVYAAPVSSLDIAPTLLAAAGVAAAHDTPSDGVDLLPMLRGEIASAPHAALFWRFGEQLAVRAGDYKLVRYDLALEDGEGDLDRAVSPPRLYRLSDDAGERHDLAAQRPDKVAELEALWRQWNASNAAPLWPSPHAGDDSEGDAHAGH